MHYTPVGRATVDSTKMGIWVAYDKPEHEIFNQNWSFWPKELYIIENYYSVFFEQDFIGYLMNSLIVCILILVVQIIT